MTYTNTQIAKQIASLLNKNKTPIFQKGNTSSTGINKEITVRLTNGKVVRALAWNVSTPGQVTVFWDAQNKRYVAWKEETSSLKRKTILANRKTRPDEKKYLWEYFIKVLQPNSVEGFDADVTLDLTGYTPVGITNTGSGYVVVLQNGDDYLFVNDNVTTEKELIDFNYIGLDYFIKFKSVNPTYTTNETIITIPSGFGYTPSFARGLTQYLSSGRSQNKIITRTGENYNTSDSLEIYNRIYINDQNVSYNTFSGYNPPPFAPLIPQAPVPTQGGNGWSLYGSFGFGESYTKSVTRNVPYKKESVINKNSSKNTTEIKEITLVTGLSETTIELLKTTTESGNFTRSSELNTSVTETWTGLQYYQFTSGSTGSSLILLSNYVGSGSGFNSENGTFNRTEIEIGDYLLLTDVDEKKHKIQTKIDETVTVNETITISADCETDIADMSYINCGDQTVVKTINQNNTVNINASYNLTEESEEFYLLDYMLFTDNIGIYSKINNHTKRTVSTTITDNQAFSIADETSGVGLPGTTGSIFSFDTYGISFYSPIYKENKLENLTTTTRNLKERYLSEVQTSALNKQEVEEVLLDYLKYFVCIQIGNVTYKIKDYPADYKNHFFFRSSLTTLTIGQSVTLTRDNSSGFNIGLSDDNEFYYKRKLKKATYTFIRNGAGTVTTDTENYEYYNSDFYLPSADCVVYQISNGVCTKWTATIQSFGYTNSYTFNGGTNEYRNFDKITITLNTSTPDAFYFWSNIYYNKIIVETSDNSTLSLLTYLRDFDGKKNSNIYTVLDENGNETVELAIAETPTTTTPNMLRADIYRFNTTSLKWERRPNAITPVSPLTEVSDFVSYHPTASNSRKKRNRLPRS